MIKKGVVVKINKDSATVMTDDSTFERIVLRGDMEIGMKIMFSNDDIIESTETRRIDSTMKKNVVIAAALALMLLAGSLFGFNILGRMDQQYAVAAFVTVDINPSFKISVDEDEMVVDIQSMNDDASEITIADLVGEPVEDAVEEIVKRAEEKGFLNIEDLEDDYVLITAIDAREDKDDDSEGMKDYAEEILEKIRERATESEPFRRVNLATIEATMKQLEEAERQNIPVGLYFATDDRRFSVREFFADEGLAEEFMEEGEIAEADYDYKVGLIATYMDLLDKEEALSDDLKADLQSAFELSKEDFFESKRLFEEAKKMYQDALDSGDEDEIEEAREILETAEEFKYWMEQNKDHIDSVKEILKKGIEGSAQEEELRYKIDEVERKRLEEEEKRQEEKQREEEKKLEEQEKREEEQAREEEKRLEEEEKRLEEQQREEEKRAEEDQKRLEEQEAEEQKRLEEQEREEEKRIEEESGN